MKSISIIILSLIMGISCKARLINLKDVATLRPSYKMLKITKGTSDSIIAALYRNSPDRPDRKPDNLDHFRIDDVVISLNSGKPASKFPQGYLSTIKSSLQNPSDKNNKVEILTVEGKQVLVSMNCSKDLGWLFFMCVNEENTATVSGQLNFRLTDEQKAKDILNDLIRQLRFKE